MMPYDKFSSNTPRPAEKPLAVRRKPVHPQPGTGPSAFDAQSAASGDRAANTSQHTPAASAAPAAPMAAALARPSQAPLPYGGIPAHSYGYVAPDVSNPAQRNWRTTEEMRANPYHIARMDPKEFAQKPVEPEIHFTDPFGVTIPGVTETRQCGRQEHPVMKWPAHEWPKYNTQLAEHGLTYEEYTRMLFGVVEIMQRAPEEISGARTFETLFLNIALLGAPAWETKKSDFKKSRAEVAAEVDTFLARVSKALQSRGVPLKFKLAVREQAPTWQALDVVVKHVHTDVPFVKPSGSPVGTPASLAPPASAPAAQSPINSASGLPHDDHALLRALLAMTPRRASGSYIIPGLKD